MLVEEIKTLKAQRVPVSSPVEHESLNLLHRNDSSRSRSREYSSSSQCNNLYKIHEIGSPSWYNELPSRSRSRSHTSNSLINNNQHKSPNSPRPFALPEPSVSPEPTNGYKSVLCIVLEPMDNKQYKLFHDEVLQMLAGLNSSLSLNYNRNWTDI
ncbi:5822_t:CDS:2, partial [Gigaspora rosea]